MTGCNLRRVKLLRASLESTQAMPPARIRKAVIPAAGLGTRFLPATKAQPKEMLPLVDKPIIQYGVEEVLGSGLSDVILVTSRGKDVMEEHFDSSPELEALLEAKGKHELLHQVREISRLVQVASVRQKEALGLGHAVLTAADLVGDEPFAVLLPDDVIDAREPVLKQMLAVYNATGYSVVAVQRIPRENISGYGVIRPAAEAAPQGSFAGPVFRATDLVEKPKPADAPSDLAVVGRYLLTPKVFELLRRTPRGAGGEIQLTDALRELARIEPVYALQFEGRRYDAGDKFGFLQATVELALKRPEFGERLRAYLRSLPLQ